MFVVCRQCEHPNKSYPKENNPICWGWLYFCHWQCRSDWWLG